MSLRAFLTRLIWLCVLPGVLVAAWLAATHVQDMQVEIDSEADRQAQNVAASIDQFLGARIGALQILASSPLADDVRQWDALYREARGLSQSFGGDVVFVGLDGRMQFHTGLPRDVDLPSRPRPAGISAVDAAIAQARPAVGDTFVAPVTGQRMVAIAAPGLRDGRPAFVMANITDEHTLARRLGDLALPPGRLVKLTDSHGATITRVGELAADNAGSHPRFVHFTARPALAPWTVVLAVPQADRLVPLLRVATIMGLAVVGAALVGVLGGRWASQRLAAAVRRLDGDAPSDGAVPGIAEIDAVRQRLDDAAQARDRAQAERRASERQFMTSLEQSAIELQVREAQLRGILDSASDAIITADESQHIVMANPAAARMFRTSVAALIGAPLDGLIPPASRARHHDDVLAFGRAEPQARPMGHQPGVTGLRCDGEEFPIEGAISHVHVDGQRLYTVILRDITERQRAEQALRISKAELEAALASMNDAVFIVDAQGGFTDFNAAFASFHRYANKADCPRMLAAYDEILEVFHADGSAAPSDEGPVMRALRGEAGVLVEYRLRRKDTGETWDGSYSYAPIRGADGTIVGAVVTARDVSGIKRVRAELEASHAELRRLVAAQDSVQEAERRRIARELHDDLQQTLAAILMESTALHSTHGPSAVDVLDGLVRIERLATSAIVSTRRIVNDLRPQILEELGLVPALEALAHRFSERTGIACNVDASRFGVPGHGAAAGVSTCLFRVAQEALNNVAKHSQAQRVDISLRESPPGHWRLRIRDDGTGLPERAWRKHGSFGLLGMRERVHAVGGSVRVHSEPGAGTTVEVDVDLAIREDGPRP